MASGLISLENRFIVLRYGLKVTNKEIVPEVQVSPRVGAKGSKGRKALSECATLVSKPTLRSFSVNYKIGLLY